VRVRTYGFPGCFTRPPGTSTRDHPHEPTASKPVVPVDAYSQQYSEHFCNAPCARGGHRRFANTATETSGNHQKPLTHRLGTRPRATPGIHSSGRLRRFNEVDAVPGRFEEPLAGRPESLPTIGGAASHLGGLALCGSGVRVFIQRTPLARLRQEVLGDFPARSEKSRLGSLHETIEEASRSH
jgi:hypothetical protein